jgi:pimeloyl-ACP methyl ester carboxylesterase
VFEVIGLSLGGCRQTPSPLVGVKLTGRGTILAYDMPGPRDAPTLLLLHGLGASGLLNWFPAFGPLSERFRVVAMDLRGHGHGLRSGSRYRLTDCADDAIALMDALEVERCIPVGYSLGGPVAQLMWRHHRDRVDGLVLCATSRNFAQASRAVGLLEPLGRLDRASPRRRVAVAAPLAARGGAAARPKRSTAYGSAVGVSRDASLRPRCDDPCRELAG